MSNTKDIIIKAATSRPSVIVEVKSDAATLRRSKKRAIRHAFANRKDAPSFVFYGRKSVLEGVKLPRGYRSYEVEEYLIRSYEVLLKAPVRGMDMTLAEAIVSVPDYSMVYLTGTIEGFNLSGNPVRVEGWTGNCRTLTALGGSDTVSPRL